MAKIFIKKFTIKDRWIFGASCLHFAAKYNPKGLSMLLSHLKIKERRNLINDTHLCDAQTQCKDTPLHVAAFNDSPSLR